MPAAKPAAKKIVKKIANDRPIVYPDVEVRICRGEDAITADIAKALLGWETEEAYKTRLAADKKGAVGFGNEFVLVDETGAKVQCWNNSRNRPFDEAWSRRLAQDILKGAWKFNFENIIIGKSGIVESGQHRLIAAVLADQMWRKHPETFPHWKTPPVIESLVAFGADEDVEILQTLDNVKPRTLSDVFYSTGQFANLSSEGRRECVRMLDRAVTFLWKRTGMDGGDSGVKVYQTHSASLEFLDRHPKVLKMVSHLYEENQERALSKLRLSPGECSAAAYLMAASASDADRYYDTSGKAPTPPSEKKLDMSRWDKAQEFFTLLAANAPEFGAVRSAIAALVDAEEGSGGRPIEKHAILAAAWNAWVEGEFDGEIPAESLTLKYVNNADGVPVLVEPATYGGIDLGAKWKAPEESPTPEEIEKAKAAERKAAADKLAGKTSSAPAKSLSDQLGEFREQHGIHTVLVIDGKEGFRCFGDDAKELAPVLQLLPKRHQGIAYIDLHTEELVEALKQWANANARKVVCLDAAGNAETWNDPEAAASKPKFKKKGMPATDSE